MIVDARLGKITLFELEILGELGQHASLRSICRSKKLGPPHLSKILSRLEAKLTTRVIQRSPKGFLLTPEGLRFAKLAREILAPADGLAQPEATAKAAPRLLTIAASRFVASHVVAPLLETLRTSYGADRFRLLDMAPDELVPTALKSTCEILVTVGEPALPKTWEVSPLGELTWGLYASRRNPIPTKISEKEVKLLPFLVPTYWHGDGYETGDDHCPMGWKERRRGDETSSVMTAIEVMRNSPEQLLFAPRIALKAFKDELKEIRVKTWPGVAKQVFLSVRSDVVSKHFERHLIRTFSPQLV